MDFEYSDKVKDLLARVTAFMDDHILPNEDRMHQQLQDDPWSTPPRSVIWTKHFEMQNHTYSPVPFQIEPFSNSG